MMTAHETPFLATEAVPDPGIIPWLVPDPVPNSNSSWFYAQENVFAFHMGKRKGDFFGAESEECLERFLTELRVIFPKSLIPPFLKPTPTFDG